MAAPSSRETSRSVTLSHLFPTNINGITLSSASLTRTIWSRNPCTRSNVALLVIEYTIRKPSPSRIHWSRNAVYSSGRTKIDLFVSIWSILFHLKSPSSAAAGMKMERNEFPQIPLVLPWGGGRTADRDRIAMPSLIFQPTKPPFALPWPAVSSTSSTHACSSITTCFRYESSIVGSYVYTFFGWEYFG